MLDDVDLLVCGAGPAGCVVAERAATLLGWKVLVIDRRRHVAGNCHDAPARNGVLVHKYGPHYFRTNSESLLHYLSRFASWQPAHYEVRSKIGNDLLPFPINLTTLEQFFGRKLDAESAEALLAEKRLPIANPSNSEEYCLSRVGKELYEAFYLQYTIKQWGLHPRELAPQVCGRVPVRLDRDNRYVSHQFQVMPVGGFTKLFARMLSHARIRTLLDCDFSEVRHLIRPRFATVYCGPIDEYFGHRLGRLPYRSLRFEFVPHATEWKQPCVQINYPDNSAYTRSVEIKHVTGQVHRETVLSLESSSATGEPFYPVPHAQSATVYEQYRELASRETSLRRVHFCGRLAQYRYFNTDEVIQEALACFQTLRKKYAASSLSSSTTAAA